MFLAASLGPKPTSLPQILKSAQHPFAPLLVNHQQMRPNRLSGKHGSELARSGLSKPCWGLKRCSLQHPQANPTPEIRNLIQTPMKPLVSLVVSWEYGNMLYGEHTPLSSTITQIIYTPYYNVVASMFSIIPNYTAPTREPQYVPRCNVVASISFFHYSYIAPTREYMGGQNYGPFWVPIIIRHLIFRVPKKGP